MHLLIIALLIFILGVPAWAVKKCEDCPRDERGRIQRSQKAVKEFKQKNPCPVHYKKTHGLS